MSKSHRGTPLRREGFLRGVCPITGRAGVKLIYEHKNEAGETIKISKSAHAKIQNQQKIVERAKKKKEAEVVTKASPVVEENVDTTA